MVADDQGRRGQAGGLIAACTGGYGAVSLQSDGHDRLELPPAGLDLLGGPGRTRTCNQTVERQSRKRVR
jgi:hypothetical protein